MDRNLQVLRFHNPARAFVGRRCARPITLALLRCILSVACYGQGTVPVADFTTSPTSGGAPLTVQFTDTSAGDITRWLWNFGDSLTSAHRNPTHEYATAGTYTVTLTVTGPAGSDTETKAGYIVLPPEGSPPVAHIAVEPSANVEVGEEVFFSAQGCTDDKSLVAGRFEWDVGDG